MSELYSEQQLRGEVAVSRDSGITIITGPATIEPASFPFVITKGADWLLNLTWQNAAGDVDLSAGYTAEFVIRYRPGDAALETLTNVDGITLGAARPNLVLALSAADTAAYTWGPRAQYALTVTTGGVKIPLLVGSVDLLGVVI